MKKYFVITVVVLATLLVLLYRDVKSLKKEIRAIETKTTVVHFNVVSETKTINKADLIMGETIKELALKDYEQKIDIRLKVIEWKRNSDIYQIESIKEIKYISNYFSIPIKYLHDLELLIREERSDYKTIDNWDFWTEYIIETKD